LFVGCVFIGVRDFGCFAEAADAAAMPDADEECGDAGGKDVAMGWWVSLWFLDCFGRGRADGDGGL
jgi:hypothetical protein